MRVDVENYGALLILHLSGSVEAAEVPTFIAEMAQKCGEIANIVVTLNRADITPTAVAPLIALRDQQRYLKPRVLLVSPKLEAADMPNLPELLAALETSEALQITKLVAAEVNLARLKARSEEIDNGLRAALGLAEGYTAEDYDAARAVAHERNQKAKLLATATAAHVEALRKSYTLPTDDAERDKRVADAKSKAYAATRGD